MHNRERWCISGGTAFTWVWRWVIGQTGITKPMGMHRLSNPCLSDQLLSLYSSTESIHYLRRSLIPDFRDRSSLARLVLSLPGITWATRQHWISRLTNRFREAYRFSRRNNGRENFVRYGTTLLDSCRKLQCNNPPSQGGNYKPPFSEDISPIQVLYQGGRQVSSLLPKRDLSNVFVGQNQFWKFDSSLVNK